MKAITLHGPGDVRVESVPDPRIVDPTDAVLRITTSAVCGSDLHQYHGRVAGLDPGVVMGHEFMGVVEEVGPAVRQIRKGDRVLAPAHAVDPGRPARSYAHHHAHHPAHGHAERVRNFRSERRPRNKGHAQALTLAHRLLL